MLKSIQSNQYDLLTGNISKTLISMTNAISLGFISLFTFNLVDTYFIAQLGSAQLAAISLTFPVVFLWMNIFFGLNTGITAQIGKYIGRQNLAAASSIAINSFLLVLLASTIVNIVGFLSIEFTFRLLGADDKLLVFIRQYLSLWYLGSSFLMLTMANGAIIRGLGNAKVPSRILIISGLINGLLDPLLIFGLGPFPRLEITGAILATVIAWIISFILSTSYIIKKTNLINNNTFFNTVINFKHDIKQVLSIGLPSLTAYILTPLSSTIVMKIVAFEGITAIAAFGVGLRLEALAILFSLSLSIAIVPFISLNYGAGHYHRINNGLKYAIKFTVIIQSAIYLILFIFANKIAQLFSNNPEIISIVTLYLRIIPGIYCFMGMIFIIISTLNATEQAKYSALINVIRFFALTIPLVYLGQKYFGITGILFGIASSKVLAFIIALFIYKKVSV